METKPLLYGLIGFFIGGLLVSVAATTFDKSATQQVDSMDMMTTSLQNKSGDAFDEAFLSGMIMHHESALDMAKLSESRAKHDEVRELSKQIIQSQQAEIDRMKKWQTEWNYDDTAHSGMMH